MPVAHSGRIACEFCMHPITPQHHGCQQDTWRDDLEALYAHAPSMHDPMQHAMVALLRARLGAVWGQPASQVLLALQEANEAAEVAVQALVCIPWL